MIKFALLESGSKGNCCIVKNQDTNIIIDCGGSKKYLNEALKQLAYNLKDTDALLVTHTHSDHIKQLKMFNDIDTYASCRLDTDHFRMLDDFETFQLNSLDVTVLPTSHDNFGSCGYKIVDQDETLVYITDTGYVSEKVKQEIINADYYIFESNHDIEMLMNTNRPIWTKQRIISDQGHLCNEDSANTLCEVIGSNTKEIVLAHISEEGNTKEKAKEVLVEAISEHDIDVNLKIVTASQNKVTIGGSKF